MICERCGKSNIQGLSECAYCGAGMPAVSGGGGFADILSYKPAETDNFSARPEVIVREIKSEGISEADMQKLIKKSDKIITSTRKNSIFGLIAVALCGAILLFTLIGGAVLFSMLNQTRAELNAITEHLGIKTEEEASPAVAAEEEEPEEEKTNHLATYKTEMGTVETKLNEANELLAAAARGDDVEKNAGAAKTAADAALSAAGKAKTAADAAKTAGEEGADEAVTKANEAVTAAGKATQSANAYLPATEKNT